MLRKRQDMTIYEYGDHKAPYVLIQPVDEHDLAGIESEITRIEKLTDARFQLLAVKVDDWNRDLSPWGAPAVWGDADFKGGARDTLEFVQGLCSDDGRKYILGGYSLAGLFALWSGCQTDAFAGIAAASPSVWFPDFVTYMRDHDMRSPVVYLSLGDREAKTKNQVMATVADCIGQCHDILDKQNLSCTLEWNPGNHFKEPDLRMAKAFAWILNLVSGAR